MIKPKKNVELKSYTTSGVGGKAKYFFVAKTIDKLIEGVSFAKSKNLPLLVLGGGSNIIISDSGFNGLVIKCEIKGIVGYKNLLKVEAGTLLSDLIATTVRQNLSGLQKLVGIPGTVGGAIFGNAGAYGASISDYLTKITVLDPTINYPTTIPKSKCSFSYRHSAFKNSNLIILEAYFKFKKAIGINLQTEVKKILKDRNSKKYWEGKSAGSFFKNVLVSEVSKEALMKIPKGQIIHGKIPAGFLLEQIGAKGMKKGGVKVSKNHANLLINTGSGKASDFLKLSQILQDKVKAKFGIELEPEVQFIF